MYIFCKISIKPFPGFRSKSFAALFFVILFIFQRPLAQVSDDFSDGDFTSNPIWKGTTADFIVNSVSQLQLNASSAGSSYLYTDFPLSDPGDFEWQFYAKQSFSPSGANFGRFYLMSDQRDLTGALNGYYLQLGEAGSGDALELFRQSGTSIASVCRGTTGAISSAFEIRVKVVRSRTGLWELDVDYRGGTDFILESSGTDATYSSSLYAGVLCNYTITNASRFYYDDFYIREIKLSDTTPPEILSVEVTSPHSVDLAFSERLDPRAAANPVNYNCIPNLGNPSSAVLLADQRTVRLSFTEAFTNGVEATLMVKDLWDLAGNQMEATEKKLLYFKPEPLQFRDIIITEIFPDPTPQVGLPSAEFVEFYNRSSNPIDLGGWILSDGTSSGIFSSFIVLPGKYVIVCSFGSLPAFESLGVAVSPAPFPSLNNSGDRIILKDPGGQTIDSLQYDLSWYRDREKSEGGWSLELIDRENTCADKSNWSASEDIEGGTPGKQNSVDANKPDNTGPKLLSVVPNTETSISLVFNEKLEDRIPGIENFISDPPLAVDKVEFTDPSLTAYILFLSGELEPSKYYRMTVKNIYDCSGNGILEAFSAASFALPETALPGDVLINEVLFNPRPTGVDFVEIYNVSEKTINLKNWSIRNSHLAATPDASLISDQVFLIAPKQYKVLTKDANVLKGEYVMGMEENFSEMALPALNDDEGSVAIVDNDGSAIDSMYYNDGMHVAFVMNSEGISLERISFEKSEGKSSNWRSASSSAGFATPGYVNSNVRADGLMNGSVMAEPRILQPDVSPNDFTRIKYHFDQGGYIANVTIFDQEGRTIRELARNELLAAEGFFRWDGEGDNGSRVRTGYYMVWFEIFDDHGTLKIYRDRIAIF